MNRWRVWVDRLRWWIPALLFLLVNLALLGGHRWVIKARAAVQLQTLEEATTELAELQADRAEREDAIERATLAREQIDGLLQDHFDTQERRWTRTMLHIKDLVRRAGVSGPSNISYGDQEVTDFPLVRKTISFSVIGSYESLRELINLVELSDQFLTLEEIRVGESESLGDLTVQLRLSTYFVDPDTAEDV